jgi:hypothetical protein
MWLAKVGQPFVARVDEIERVCEPAPALRLEPRDDRLEVALVALAMGMLRLEEQDDLRPAVRDPVVRPLDHALVREPDALVASADPGVAIGGLAEDVEAPELRVRVANPGLVGLLELVAGLRKWRSSTGPRDDEDLEPGERLGDLVDAAVRDGDLEILVLAVLSAQVEVDRPAGRDVPGRVNTGEQALRVLGTPRIPLELERV